jgi:L-arabinokinase
MHIAILRHEEIRNELKAARGDADAEAGVADAAAVETDLLRDAGELMYAAHRSYSERLDLGSPETDLLVDLVREQGPDRGLYGARITGGGSGGTVAILCAAGSPAADEALAGVCREYERRSGNVPRVFTGSSPGAVMFGARRIMRG